MSAGSAWSFHASPFAPYRVEAGEFGNALGVEAEAAGRPWAASPAPRWGRVLVCYPLLSCGHLFSKGPKLCPAGSSLRQSERCVRPTGRAHHALSAGVRAPLSPGIAHGEHYAASSAAPGALIHEEPQQLAGRCNIAAVCSTSMLDSPRDEPTPQRWRTLPFTSEQGAECPVGDLRPAGHLFTWDRA